jgi:PAS domain-containing protein
MLGATAQQSVTAGGLPYLNALVRDLAREPVASGEVPFARKDGTRMVCQVTLSRLRDEHGAPIGLIGIARDVTGERETAARLTEATATANRRTSELRAVADMAGILVSGSDADTAFAALARRILETGTFDIATISLYDAERDAVSLHQLHHGPAHVPEALAGARDRWVPAARLPLLRRVMRERRPLVVHEGDPLWQSSTLIRWNTKRERLRLVVATPLLYRDELIGTLVLYACADRPVPPEEERLLQALADQVALAVHTARSLGRIRDMRRDAIFRLALACETRDEETAAHLRRIQWMTEALCRELGLDVAEADEIGLSAVLHDVGKITVPEAVLRKEGAFTAEERELARLHTIRGEELLSGPEFYATARQIARHHHERWDGSGYPDGLAGLAIPRPARIVAVADVYDALIRRRSHKSAWDPGEAAAYILDHAGLHFDPAVVGAFEALWRRDGLEGACSPG